MMHARRGYRTYGTCAAVFPSGCGMCRVLTTFPVLFDPRVSCLVSDDLVDLRHVHLVSCCRCASRSKRVLKFHVLVTTYDDVISDAEMLAQVPW